MYLLRVSFDCLSHPTTVWRYLDMSYDIRTLAVFMFWSKRSRSPAVSALGMGAGLSIESGSHHSGLSSRRIGDVSVRLLGQ
jgi:hypothetical protein